jgi:hypothetical protein
VLAILILMAALCAAYFGLTLALHVYRTRTDQQYRYEIDEELHERRLLQAYKPRTPQERQASLRSGPF